MSLKIGYLIHRASMAFEIRKVTELSTCETLKERGFLTVAFASLGHVMINIAFALNYFLQNFDIYL